MKTQTNAQCVLTPPARPNPWLSTRKKMGLCALVLVGLVATGARWATAADQYTTGKVGTIVVGPTGDFTFHLEGLPLLCNRAPTGDGRDWVTVTGYATPDGKKELLTVLMSAKLSGRSVQVRGLNNATPNEWGCRLEGVDFL
jgi:hypothetical protein